MLVVDDMEINRASLESIFETDYRILQAGDGEEALRILEEQNYKVDMILLDLMMPGMNGQTFMQERKNDPRILNIPVVIITADDTTEQQVLTMELGASDYIVKPFETVELLARIEVVLRRKHKSNNTIHYGDITMNIDEHTVKKGDDYVSLTPKEFDILAFFLQNQDIALTRERLLATVWGYEFMGETRTVDIHVQQIRKKMGLHNKLVTIPKLGYRLERNN